MSELSFDLPDDESAMETIETAAKLADENNIDRASAGGSALILCGQQRINLKC